LEYYYREQQHQQIRAMRASENVHAHNVAKLTSKYETRLAEQERYFVNVYYKYGSDNIYYDKTQNDIIALNL
jgi:hypothetical protein